MKNINKTKYGVVKEWDFIAVLHAKDVYKDLIKKGYINAEGYLQEKFILLKDSSEMVLDPAFAEQQFEIHMTLRQKQNIKFTNEISEELKANGVETNEFKLPKQAQCIVNAISNIIKFLVRGMNNTLATFELIKTTISKFLSLVKETILKIIRNFVRRISIIIKATFEFILSVWKIFWDVREDILTYLFLYIPSGALYAVGFVLRGISKPWTVRLYFMAKSWAILVFVLTILLAIFMNNKKHNNRNDKTKF